MRWAAAAALIVVWIAGSTSSGSPQTAASPQAFLEKYCLTCHSESSKQKGIVPIALDSLDFSNVAKDAEIWEKVIRKVDAGVMPPPGTSRPDRAAALGFTASLKADLDRTAQANPNPGRPLLHRLNRAEYANAIRDLL